MLAAKNFTFGRGLQDVVVATVPSAWGRGAREGVGPGKRIKTKRERGKFRVMHYGFGRDTFFSGVSSPPPPPRRGIKLSFYDNSLFLPLLLAPPPPHPPKMTWLACVLLTLLPNFHRIMSNRGVSLIRESVTKIAFVKNLKKTERKRIHTAESKYIFVFEYIPQEYAEWGIFSDRGID